MSEMQKIEIFLEVLILGELGRAKCRNGGFLMGKIARGRANWAWQFADRFSGAGVCLRVTPKDSTENSIMSILSMSYSNTRFPD
jgi:hypothetical protein